jgi:hypothetical protein
MTTSELIASAVTQANHNFSRGTVVRFNGTNWVVSTSGVAGSGVVGSIQDSNTFEFVQVGLLDGLDGLTPGALYYPTSSGQLSTTVNGTAIGLAYDSDTLLVQPVSQVAGNIDPSTYVTSPQLTAAIAAAQAVAAAALAAHNHDSRYIHSVDLDGVISVDPGNSGVVFLETDGTQVLTG